MKKKWFDIVCAVLVIAAIAVSGTMLMKCQAQNMRAVHDSYVEKAQEGSVMEYYDWDNIPDGGILMYPDGVIDFIYCTQDNEYIIEYDDPDAFDPDNIPQTVSCVSNSEPVVQIYCSEELFFEYLDWYNSLTNKDSVFFEASDRYFIKLDHVGNPTDGYDYYKLITN